MMGKGGSFDFKEIEKLQKQMEQLERDRDKFCEACAKELAARLLAKVIKRTPVGDYSGQSYSCNVREGPNLKHKGQKVKGMVGGTLRRGWTAQVSGSGAEGMKTRGAAQYVDTLKVHHFGDTYVIEITNPVEYASYVEYGHRTVNHKGWVQGHFMLTISEQQLQSPAPAILEKKLTNYLKGVFHV